MDSLKDVQDRPTAPTNPPQYVAKPPTEDPYAALAPDLFQSDQQEPVSILPTTPDGVQGQSNVTIVPDNQNLPVPAVAADPNAAAAWNGAKAQTAPPPSLVPGGIPSTMVDAGNLFEEPNAPPQVTSSTPEMVHGKDIMGSAGNLFEEPVPHNGMPTSGTGLNDAVARAKYDGRPGKFASDLLPKDVKVAYIQDGSRATVSTLRAPVLDATYNMKKMAEQDGYQLLVTSGTDGTHSTNSFHYYGEAVDFRVLDKNGKDLPRDAEARLGARYADAAGFGSMVDELHFTPNGDPKSVGDNPHMHVTWAPERGTAKIATSIFHDRSPGDKNYLNSFTPTTPMTASKDDPLTRKAQIYAIQMGIDPDVFGRVVSAESGWNPNARSPVGAFGLTQLMPATAAALAKEDGKTVEDIRKDPNLQLYYGAKYLKQKLDDPAMGGSYPRVLAAYNAGSGAVAGFIAGKPVYAETKNYVQKILGSIDSSGIKTADDAAAAIVAGTGYMHSPDHIENQRQAVVNDVVKPSSDLLSKVMGFQVGGVSLESLGSAMNSPQNAVTGPNSRFNQLGSWMGADTFMGRLLSQSGMMNPLGEDANTTTLGQIGNASASTAMQVASGMAEWTNQFAHLVSWGGVPGSKAIEQIGEDTTGSGMGKVLSYGALNLTAAIPAMDMTLGWMAGKVARTLGVIPGSLKLAEGASTYSLGHQFMRKAFSGGYGATAFASVAAVGTLAAQGFLQSGLENFMDYYYNPTEESQKMTMSEKVHHSLAVGMLGAGFNLLLGAVLPAMATGGEAYLRGISVGELATAKALAPQNIVRRSMAGAVKGMGVGGAVSAAANMAGLDEAVSGHPVTAQDAVLNGIGYGGLMGSLAYGGLPFGTRALSAAAKSHPSIGLALDAARDVFSRISPENMNSITAAFTEQGARIQRDAGYTSIKTVTGDVAARTQSYMEDLGKTKENMNAKVQQQTQVFQQSQQMVDQLTKKVQAAPTAIPDFQTRMSEYTDLQDNLKTTREQRDTSRQQNPQDPQTQAYGERYQSAQKKISDFEKTTDEDSGLNWNRKVAGIYQNQADLATRAPAMQQQEMKLKATQTKFKQLSDSLTMVQQNQQAHIDVLNRFQAINSDPTNAPLFSKTNAELMDLYRKTLDNSHPLNTEFLSHLSNSIESGFQKVTGQGNKVDPEFLKQTTLAFAKKIDDGYSQESINLLKATRDPNSIYGQTVLRNVKAIFPYLADITPQFDVNFHKMTADSKAISGNFKDVYQSMKSSRSGGNWSPEKMNDWANQKDRMQKLTYDYEGASNQEIAQVRPSIVQDYIKQVAEKYTGTSDSFSPDKVNSKYLMDKLGDIQSKGLPIHDMDSITKQLSKDPTSSNALSALHGLYDQAVVAENAGDTHMPMGSSQYHGKAIQRDVFTANANFLKKALADKATEWNRVANRFAPEVVEGTSSSQGGNDYTKGAYTDLAYNPEYVVRSAYQTADGEALLRSQFKVDPSTKLLKFDNKAVLDNVQGELNRLSEFNDMVVGQQQPKPMSKETMGSVGVDRSGGNNVKHLVLDSTRQNLAEKIGDAAHSDPNLEKTWDTYFDPTSGVGILMDDRNSMRSHESMYMSQLTNPQGNIEISKVRGWTAGTFDENIYSRNKAFSRIMNELHGNFQDLVQRSIDTVNEDRKVGKGDVISKDEFQKDIRNVLEGSDSLAAVRDKYKRADGSTTHVDSVVGYSNRIKALTETIKAANPSLGDFMRPMYLHAIFPDVMAKMAAHGTGSSFGGPLSSENKSGIKSLKQLEGWVQDTKQEIKSKMGITSPNSLKPGAEFDYKAFESLPLGERVQILENINPENFKQLKITDLEKYKEIVNKVNEKSLAYLYEKPLTDLPHIVTAEFRSAILADGWRRTMQFMKNSPVDLDGKGQVRPMLQVFEQSTKQTDIHFKDPSGKDMAYQAFSEIPGQRNFTTTIDGEPVNGNQIMLHPEAFNFFKNNLDPTPSTMLGPLAKTGFAQAVSRVHNLARSFGLMGTWIPHLAQVMGTIQAGFMIAPIEAASIVPLGRRIAEENSLSSNQIMIHAIRSGVNSRAMDQGTRFLAGEIATVLGSDMSSKLWGVADESWGNRFFQSLDSHDRNQKDAYNLLSPGWKAASDFMGGGPEYNRLQLQNSLYSAIEAGMFGSFYHEIGTMQKAMGGTLGKMDPSISTKILEKTAAQLTNMRAGALPYFATPTSFRRELGELALAPGWVVSKANMIIDAFDGALGLGQKTLGQLVGKSVDASELVSLGDLFAKAGFQKRYENYPPEARQYIRERMAQGVGSLLVAGAGMSIAFSMMQNGAPPWAVNAPDKIFHFKIGDTYWSNPLMVGSVRDILRFVGDLRNTDKDAIAKIGDAISGIVERNLSPDVVALEQWGRGKDEDGKPITIDARQGLVASIPQRLADYGSYVLRKSANWEGLTGTKDNPQLADLLRRNPDYMTKTQTSAEFLARSAGSYNSYYNISEHASKDAKERLDPYRFMLADRVEGIVKSARTAQQEGRTQDVQKLLGMIPQVANNGIEFRDDDLKKAYASQGGKFHLSSDEIMNIVERIMNPEGYAAKRQTAATGDGAIAGQKTVRLNEEAKASQDWWKK